MRKTTNKDHGFLMFFPADNAIATLVDEHRSFSLF
jgi:hypothetical protein